MDRLMERIRNRDESSFILIIDKYSRLMWKIAWDTLKDSANAADIEDCISEVFYKLWKSPETLDPYKGNLKNYLARMTRNVAIDLLHKRTRENIVALDEAVLRSRGTVHLLLSRTVKETESK